MFGMKALSAAALAVMPFAANAATLVYEATFTSTLQFTPLVRYAHDAITWDPVPGFDASSYSIAGLGLSTSWFDGMENGESRQGLLRVFADGPLSVSTTNLSVECQLSGTQRNYCYAGSGQTGSIWPTFEFAPGGEGFEQRGGGMFFVQSVRIDGASGFYYYEDDASYSGVTEDGIAWGTVTSGAVTIFSLSDVTVTQPAPIPLPGSGVLLGGMVVGLGLRRLVRARQAA